MGLLFVSLGASTYAESIRMDDMLAAASEDPDVLADMSLEQLMNIDVTSVAGVEHPWFDTPAAITVITNEEIRRNGFRSLVEALRMVPGMTVGQITSNQYAVSSRGFAMRFADKMIVRIDGRNVYDRTFSGTFWDMQNVLLEDVDRIEVIRGPGATLWGSNAINGVISVTTRTAFETTGLYLTGGYGTEHRGFGGVRYGAKINEHAAFRVDTMYFNRDALVDNHGNDANDEWDFFRSSFRMDFDNHENAKLMVQGAVYHTPRLGITTPVPQPTGHLAETVVNNEGRGTGGHLLTRLTIETDDWGEFTTQIYFDRTETVRAAGLRLTRETVDFDFRHHVEPFDNHEIVWGVAFQYTSDKTRSNGFLSFEPAEREDMLFSGFIQDTITLIPDKLFVMLGSKFEHNDYSGFEYQPSGRMWYRFNDEHMIWGAISRSVRTPARTTENLRLITSYVDTGLAMGGAASGVIVPLTVQGDPDIDSEEVLTGELGYRARPMPEMTLDVTGFISEYRNYATLNPPAQLQFQADGYATSTGVELALDWRVADNWRLSGSYSFLHLDFRGASLVDYENTHASHKAQIHSYWDVTDKLELNTAMYYVGQVSAAGANPYLRWDLGMTYRPNENLEISLWGQNLLDSSHREFVDELFQDRPVEAQRGVYLQVTFRF